MAGIVPDIEARLRRSVRSATLGAAAFVFAVTGLGLLSAALWVLIAMHHGALTAFVATGGLFLVLAGAFYWAASLGRMPRRTARPAATDEPFFRMAEGFAAGMQAGRAARKH
ncbi:MAG: phage holin family protein [Paracoccaceae bacterium]